MENYMYDKEFLKQLDYNRDKETYVNIISLNNEDLPIEEITGKVTEGSINIDGASAVRRTCSLSLIANETEEMINDSNWCYNTKFKLKIGLKNNINSNYPDIIWFNMGIYIITNFNKSTTTNNLTVQISGQDKMCRLNGTVSGNIPMSTDFGTIDTTEKVGGEYQITTEKLPIYQIIQNALQEYAQEQPYNIIINDLDKYGYELWEYNGVDPMYMIIKKGSNSAAAVKEVLNIIFEDIQVTINNVKYNISEIDGDSCNGKYYSFNTLDPNYNDDATIITYCGQTCYVAKIIGGDTAGYHRIPLVYNADLILNAGDTITSLLDKLKAMLGEYEYFYDLEGRFIFQKKKTYIQELFSPINGEIINPSMYVSQYSYKFDDNSLFTSISENPSINNLKNDFSLWGVKGGTDLPLHIRYSINKKPISYISLQLDENKNNEPIEYNTENYDWRELIYQMAIDHFAHNKESDFLIKLQQNNNWIKNGKTGYEQYYSDMLSFWRELYNPLITDKDKEYANLGKYEYYNKEENYKYWNKNIHIDPNQFNFWFDFLDTTGDFGEYSVQKIGIRTKVIKEDQVKSIYYKETPEALFYLPERNETLDDLDPTSYTPIQIQESNEILFTKSAQGIAAISKINDIIYQNIGINQSLSISSIPIYYLQPNTKIYIQEYGDYIINKITYSLSNSGIMNIACNKIFKQFY